MPRKGKVAVNKHNIKLHIIYNNNYNIRLNMAPLLEFHTVVIITKFSIIMLCLLLKSIIIFIIINNDNIINNNN